MASTCVCLLSKLYEIWKSSNSPREKGARGNKHNPTSVTLPNGQAIPMEEPQGLRRSEYYEYVLHTYKTYVLSIHMYMSDV